jgi:surface protein
MSEIKSKIGLTPKGAYSSAATYDYLDYVSSTDGIYTSKQASNTGHALTETDWWEHDYIVPKTRVNSTTMTWEISYDGGTTYTDTGISAKGAGTSVDITQSYKTLNGLNYWAWREAGSNKIIKTIVPTNLTSMASKFNNKFTAKGLSEFVGLTDMLNNNTVDDNYIMNTNEWCVFTNADYKFDYVTPDSFKNYLRCSEVPYFVGDKFTEKYSNPLMNVLYVTYVKATSAINITFSFKADGKAQLFVNGTSISQCYNTTKSITISLVAGWNEIAITEATHNDGLSVTVNTQLSKISGIEEMKSGYNKNYINDISDLFLTYPNTSAVTSMESMFRNCVALTTLDLGNFDTSAVTNMSAMFYNCAALTTLDLGNFDTSAVTNMSVMFYNCAALTTLDLGNFDTSAVTNMSSMFSHCYALTTLDLGNFDTSAVTDMSGMFNYCVALTTLDLGNFDTSAVTDMSYMFNYCVALTTLDLGNFDTSAVTSMSYMFHNCVALTTLDLGNFDTSAVTSMSYMFNNCYALTTITGVISGIKISLNISHSPLSRESALVIINGLADLTEGTAQTLTLSSKTKVLLTDADKLIATNKNWTIA